MTKGKQDLDVGLGTILVWYFGNESTSPRPTAYTLSKLGLKSVWHKLGVKGGKFKPNFPPLSSHYDTEVIGNVRY